MFNEEAKIEVAEMTPHHGYNVCTFDDMSPEGEMLTLVYHAHNQAEAEQVAQYYRAMGDTTYVYGDRPLIESVAIPSSLSNVSIGAKKTRYQYTQEFEGDNYPYDDQHKLNYVALGSKTDMQQPMTNEEGALEFSSLDVQGFENSQGVHFEPPMKTFSETADQEYEPQLARYVYQRPHEADDICYQFSQRVWDLNDHKNRPVPPSEGLGYTNTHPNCVCYWLPLSSTSKEVGVTSKSENEHFEHINRLIGQRARHHTLHTVKPTGELSTRTRGSNPLHEIRETIAQLASEFAWIDDEYKEKLQKILPSIGKGHLFLIRASGETITDHRNDPMAMEPYRRKLDGMELHALTRTGIGKTTDINHLGEKFMTEGLVLDAEFDMDRLESQMLVYESDPEIIAGIASGEISEVSINAGTPRKMSIECETGECFVVPRGLVLGEMDGIAFTWVVSSQNGFFWRGQHIPKAKAGVKNTKIELLV